MQQASVLMPGATLLLLTASGEPYVALNTEPAAGAAVSAALPESTLPLQVAGESYGTLIARGPDVQRSDAQALLHLTCVNLTRLLSCTLDARELAQETLDRYREINLLYRMAETVGISLDPDEIPHLILEEAAHVIQADVGAVVLQGQGGAQACTLYDVAASSRLLEEIVLVATPDSLTEPRSGILTTDQLPSYVQSLGSVLCVPMKVHERYVGSVNLGRVVGQPVFTAGDQKLLLALSGQAGAAIENARLFASLKQQRDAIAKMKDDMDNIFASIGSGIITLDGEQVIAIINPAAERILGVRACDVLGQPYQDALPGVGKQLAMLVDIVRQRDEAVFGYELRPSVPMRGSLNLRLHLSPLKDRQNRTTGIAIVLDDLTQQRQLEALVRMVRGTFERYVPPQVVEQLLSDPSQVRLGGVRREVTILFADARSFTAFSQRLDPEAVVELLNRHLTLMADAILDEEGTLDKFMGDGVMALFNAPLSQPDHALRAVRAALRMQAAIAALRDQLPAEQFLSFGVGITTGPAVVGNVGSPSLQNYTAIGDSVNLASRLQSYASPGQILLNTAAYTYVQNEVEACELGRINFKGHSEPDLVYQVLGLRQ
ncbi:MAG: adenylate/guanylate cyclase domain-containing protein [Anaerolineae bacterium]|nr:adenylate/guanylate cyclase domain-containing protein [Anaerolineae bacterium]